MTESGNEGDYSNFQHLISYLIHNVIRTLNFAENTQSEGTTFQTTDANKEQHSAKPYLHKCFSA